jgi:predicted MFS family arabinose efflux permease
MIHADGSDRPFSQSIIVGDSFIAYKPDGFAKAELRAPLEIQKKDHKVFKYLPRSSRNSAKIAKLVDSPVQDQNVMTDDRPFAYPIEWAYLAPASWGGKTTARNWRALDNRSRVVPVVFLLLLVAFAFAIHRRIEKRDHRLKTKHIAYFVVTGFAYMCVEMGLIGKYDLFLGNPLYSMALISAVFLFSNGMGSLSVGWVRKRFPLYAVAGAALLATLFTLVTADLIIPRLIGLELAAKIPIVVLLIMPIGFVLGMFFPYAVSQNEDDPTFNVSSAYGFSVLSSVLGGTYSLAVMMNLGYRSLLLHSAVCYSLMAVVIFLYRRSLKSKVT